MIEQSRAGARHRDVAQEREAGVLPLDLARMDSGWDTASMVLTISNKCLCSAQSCRTFLTFKALLVNIRDIST